MTLRIGSLAACYALLASAAARGAAQQPGASGSSSPIPVPAVGEMAPDFTLRGVTRYGILRDTQTLSGFRGQTVVLWLFIKARTRG